MSPKKLKLWICLQKKNINLSPKEKNKKNKKTKIQVCGNYWKSEISKRHTQGMTLGHNKWLLTVVHNGFHPSLFCCFSSVLCINRTFHHHYSGHLPNTISRLVNEWCCRKQECINSIRNIDFTKIISVFRNSITC